LEVRGFEDEATKTTFPANNNNQYQVWRCEMRLASSPL